MTGNKNDDWRAALCNNHQKSCSVSHCAIEGKLHKFCAINHMTLRNNGTMSCNNCLFLGCSTLTTGPSLFLFDMQSPYPWNIKYCNVTVVYFWRCRNLHAIESNLILLLSLYEASYIYPRGSNHVHVIYVIIHPIPLLSTMADCDMAPSSIILATACWTVIGSGMLGHPPNMSERLLHSNAMLAHSYSLMLLL